jgi:hypothetical protein
VVKCRGVVESNELTSHSLWVFAHIVLFVYWLGADLGVLLLAREARRRDLTLAERGFALRMALVIDFLPRIAFALMLPVGIELTRSGGYAEIPDGARLLAWVFALGWITLIVMLGRAGATPKGATLNRWHLAIQGIACVALGAVAVYALLTDNLFTQNWLALKLLLYAAIFALGIGIDYAFRPVAPAFVSIATEGSNASNEAAVKRGIDGAIRYVLTLYAMLFVIAFLGVTKPF